MTIIGVSGYAGAGKDTVGQILVEEHGFTRVAFADKLKTLALELDPTLEVTAWVHMRLSEIIADFGDEETAKNRVPAVRKYYQDLGVGVRNHLGSDAWVDAALAEYKDDFLFNAGHPDGLPRIVVTDVRFQNEANAIGYLGGHVWRVTRPGVEPVNGHVSEHDLDDWPFDAHLNNEGTINDLRVLVAALVKSEVLA